MGLILEESIVLNEKNKKYLNKHKPTIFSMGRHLLLFTSLRYQVSLLHIEYIYTYTTYTYIYIVHRRTCNINVCVCRYLVCLPFIFIFLLCYLCFVRHAFCVSFCKSSALFIATECTKNFKCRARKIFLNLLGKKIRLLGYFLAYKRRTAYVLFVASEIM